MGAGVRQVHGMEEKINERGVSVGRNADYQRRRNHGCTKVGEDGR